MPTPNPVQSLQVQDIVNRAYRLINVMGAPERGLSEEQTTEGVRALNVMTDAWQTENLLLYVMLRTGFNLVAGQQVYTIGSSALGAPDWDTYPDDRPASIPGASVTININGQPTEVVIEGLTWEQWQFTPVKQLDTTYPIKFWYDYQYPFGKFWCWPTPQTVNQVNLYIKQLLGGSVYTSPSNIIVLPQGYIRALTYNLAVELSPGYPDHPLSEIVLATGISSKADIKRANTRILDASSDPALAPKGGWFNIWSGYYQQT